jgi:beta-lactamase class A
MDLLSLERQINKFISNIKCKAGIVIETDEGTININGNIETPAASTIKIPIMLECLKQSQDGLLNLSNKINISSNACVGGSGILKSLSENTSLPFIDLIKLMIIVSDNTASNLIIKQIGFSSINERCEKLGCSNTRLERMFMDFEALKEGKNNFTSAEDMVKLLRELDGGSLLNDHYKAIAFSILLDQQFNGKLPAYNQSKDVSIAHKTGELAGVEHDVGLFRYHDKTVYAAILLTQLDNNVYGQQTITQIGDSIIQYLGVK